jgi:hypothetical protein
MLSITKDLSVMITYL